MQFSEEICWDRGARVRPGVCDDLLGEFFWAVALAWALLCIENSMGCSTVELKSQSNE